jgi:hypothetical protein
LSPSPPIRYKQRPSHSPIMPLSFKLSLSLVFPHQNLVSSRHVLQAKPISLFSIYYADNTGWIVQVMRFLNLQLPPVPLSRLLSLKFFLSTLNSNNFCYTHIEWMEVFLPNLAIKKTPGLQRHL